MGLSNNKNDIRKGKPPHVLTKEQILQAMRVTKSNKEASRYLHVSYQTYKKYAKLYVDEKTGKTLHDLHRNPGGKGVPKYLPQKGNKEDKIDLVEFLGGKLENHNYDPQKVKHRFIRAGFLKEECEICKFQIRRKLDFKIPLLLNFRNKKVGDYRIENLELLCYNCYFLYVGDVYNEADERKLETQNKVNETTPLAELELDGYIKEKLKSLGDYEDDILESISKPFYSPPEVEEESEYDIVSGKMKSQLKNKGG